MSIEIDNYGQNTSAPNSREGEVKYRWYVKALMKSHLAFTESQAIAETVLFSALLLIISGMLFMYPSIQKSKVIPIPVKYGSVDQTKYVVPLDLVNVKTK